MLGLVRPPLRNSMDLNWKAMNMIERRRLNWGNISFSIRTNSLFLFSHRFNLVKNRRVKVWELKGPPGTFGVMFGTHWFSLGEVEKPKGFRIDFVGLGIFSRIWGFRTPFFFLFSCPQLGFGWIGPQELGR